ncbi:hypothetical protein [Flavivirga eckloniae]|uniref:Uncharacterized protein n=1 Tax=Flavivirga eckloniae TaxID=1803846 RepID=A0A2K9PVC4_9FLAO|nr:hypothetical protein [Flavivirga eckloniae]AUP81009.1 hypothetical protein C1H87_20745 [Flavivirga eckloniae]
MKYFTHPKGIFEIRIPLDWYYKNEVAGYENKSPFSFELFENTQGCFQLSCYHKNENKLNSNLPKGQYNQDKLKFIQSELPDSEFKMILWATVVEDYFFMAKYICQPTKKNLKVINKQIEKVEKCLSTLMCLSEDRRDFVISCDRFEKFNASLAASFDLKNKALGNRSFIELIIINANQIDAYLRLCIALKFQIIEKSSLFKLEYLLQSENDRPIMEKKIYDKAKLMDILSDEQHDKLYTLYGLRNKVVHRYIITDIKTRELMDIGYQYEVLCEEIRLVLANIETEQFEKKLGYHGLKDPHRDRDQDHVNELYSMVNAKHFYEEFYREI